MLAFQHSFPGGSCSPDCAAMTDTLRITSAYANLQTVTDELTCIGDIVNLEVLSGPPGLESQSFVQVTFFDVRAAARAMSTFGSQWCTAMLQVADRTVCMSGELKLDARMCEESISNICDDPTREGAFIVEFYDSRVAAHMRERLRLENSDMCWAGILNAWDTEREECALSCQSQKSYAGSVWWRPAHATVCASEERDSLSQGIGANLRLAVDASTLQSSVPMSAPLTTDVDVRLTGLPNAICTPEMLEAVLQQAGLDAAVLASRAEQGRPCGEAHVTLASSDAAAACIAHFHGCQWDSSGVGVRATIIDPETPISKLPSAKPFSESVAARNSKLATHGKGGSGENSKGKGGKAPATFSGPRLPPGLSFPSVHGNSAKHRGSVASDSTRSASNSDPQSDAEAEETLWAAVA